VAGTPTTNGTADLHLTGASSGDTIRVWASSVSNQFEDEVFLYDFKHRGDVPNNGHVLNLKGLTPQSFVQFAKVPGTGEASHQPPTFTIEQITFPCTEIEVQNPGTESFYVDFMVFGPVVDSVGNRTFKGFYQWDPSIAAI
jgi:hypothetical protein